MDPEYLSILMCPKTRGTLRLATDAEILDINQKIKAGVVSGDALEAGLVSECGSFLYPIRDGIPVLLADEALPLGASPRHSSPNESSA